MQEMLRILFLILFVFQTEASVAKTVSKFKTAFTAIEAQDWEKAFKIAKADGRLAENIVMWHYLRAGAGTHQQAARFLHRQSDWPGIKLLRKKSEAAFVRASPADSVAFFEDTEPQTGTGALIYAKALSRLGKDKLAQTVIISAWRNSNWPPKKSWRSWRAISLFWPPITKPDWSKLYGRVGAVMPKACSHMCPRPPRTLAKPAWG